MVLFLLRHQSKKAAQKKGHPLDEEKVPGTVNLLAWQSDQSINELYATGLPLGALEKESYDLIKETMDTGDVLVMLSDGLPERTNTLNAQLDYPAVERCVQEHAHKSPSEIINELERLGDSFSNGEPHADDITIVVLKKK